MSRKKIIIIGGGAAGLMVAEKYCDDFEVVVLEKGKTVGRKFLVAGKGGFNLTNQSVGNELTEKYLPNKFLKKSLLENDSVKMRDWLAQLEIPTFIGTSGRVFPEKGIKPIHVLKKIKDSILKKGGQIFCNHEFLGFEKNSKIKVSIEDETKIMEADYFVFALGGSSWKVTGADGKWIDAFKKIGLKINEFQASNCGLNINWSKPVLDHHEGKPLKNIKISIQNFEVKGEALITNYGLEGNAIYPLTHQIRDAFSKNKKPNIAIDFKPNNTRKELLNKLKNKNPKTKIYSQALNLNSTEMALIKSFSEKDSFLEPTNFVELVKCLAIPIESLRPIDEAISTVGGIDLSEVNKDFSLKKYPNIFVIGEMLDWDAPTGGFLLQACFSMANAMSVNS